MAILHARVSNGQFVVSEPTELPEGTVVELLLLADEDEMSPEERAEIEASIDRGIVQMARGEGSPAEDVLRRLRSV